MLDCYKIVETDNFGRDYPNEKFATPYQFSKQDAEKVAKCLNDIFCPNGNENRYFIVVKHDYVLRPGFEP